MVVLMIFFNPKCAAEAAKTIICEIIVALLWMHQLLLLPWLGGVIDSLGGFKLYSLGCGVMVGVENISGSQGWHEYDINLVLFSP